MLSIQRWWSSSIRLCLLMVCVLVNASSMAASLPEQRALYEHAKEALKARDVARFNTLRSQLDHYPLTVYLDYQALSRTLHEASLSDVQHFLTEAQDTPLAPLIRQRYLHQLGLRRQWKNFLTLSNDQEPPTTSLRCYYYRAKLHQGNKSAAWLGAQALWMNGRSQPDACDPLFAAWHKAGKRTDEDVWERMLLAYQAKRGSLVSYLSQLLTDHKFKKDGRLLLTAYRRPEHMLTHNALHTDTPRHRDIIAAALSRIARANPERAVKYWQKLQSQYEFLETDRHEINQQIALYQLLNHQSSPWLDKTLKSLRIDTLTELKIREVLANQDWQALPKWLAVLTPANRNTDRWQYWRARALEKDRHHQQAQQVLKAVATHRSFYGFMAAEQVGMPFYLNNDEATSDTEISASARNALARIKELYAIDADQQTKYEWSYLVGRLDEDETIAVTQYAKQQGWHHLAITGAINARKWDDMALRFPTTAFTKLFNKYGKQNAIPATLLMAISRRESSFDRFARSSVGARGLMQLRPSTARHVARKMRHSGYRSQKQLYNASTNIKLGASYLHELLEQFDGNRIVSIAAYNAGPYKVRQWLDKSSGERPYDVWIETIPYRETREYVQAVLSYQVIFSQLVDNDKPYLLTTAEHRKL